MYFPWYRKDKMLTTQCESNNASIALSRYSVHDSPTRQPNGSFARRRQCARLLLETPSLGIHTSEPDWPLRRSAEFNSGVPGLQATHDVDHMMRCCYTWVTSRKDFINAPISRWIVHRSKILCTTLIIFKKKQY